MASGDIRQRKEPVAKRSNGLQEEELLEEEEQEEVIEQFEREAARQERYTRSLVSLLGFLLAALYVGFAFHQTVSPWGAPHHAAFIGILKPSAVVTGELGGSAAVLLATMALMVFRMDQPARLWKQLLQLGGTLAIFEAVFWGTAVWKVIRQGSSVGVWRVLWMPVAPFLFVLVIMHCINTLAALTPELAVLKASKYRYKKA